MKDDFYHYQKEITIRNLVYETRRLEKEIKKFQEKAEKNKSILDLHDQLEKDFFSTDSLESLIIKLINCLQIRPKIDFVSLCLSRQYLETMVGTDLYEQYLDRIGVSTKLGYLSIIHESDLTQYLGEKTNTLFEKTPKGSYDILFPDHGDEVRSHAIIPLILRSQIIGSLNIGSILGRHYYTTEEGPDLLDRLSGKLAIAIDNILSHKRQALQKEILDRDINSAAVLQKSLLPASSLQTESLEIVTYFRPCQKLGGDFYDYIILSPQRLAVIVADVAGHGISAALIAAMLKVSLQMDDIGDLPPEEMVSKINRKFCQILKHDDYITLCYGIIDTKQSILNLVRGGHPYPVLYQASVKDASELRSSGPPLGIDMEASYENMEVQLHPGDTIFFYTDGLTEAVFPKSQPNDINALISLWGAEFDGGCQLERFHSEIEGLLKDKELEDDTSLLVVKLK